MNNASPRLRRAYFECRHGQLHVHNAIPDGGGFDEQTTLICLHGGGGSGRMFLELSRRLGTSRSIYSPDLPGCGESDSAASSLSVSAYADAIGDFLDSMRFRQVDSRTDPRVQVADVLAGLARRLAAAEMHGRGDAELCGLLRAHVDPASRWCDEAMWAGSPAGAC